MENIPRLENIFDFYPYIILFILIVFVALKSIFNLYIKFILTNNIKNQVSENSYLLAGINSTLAVILFSFLFLPFSNLNKELLFLNTLSHYVILLILFFLVFFIKNSISIAFFYIIQEEEEADFLFKKKNFFLAWRLLLIILLICFNMFSPFYLENITKLIICISFIILSYTIEWFYLYILDKNYINFLWYYKILYLCTLEILPLLIIYKVIFGNLILFEFE